MACEAWREKLEAYVDGELPADDARRIDEHLRGCAACAAESLKRFELKQAVQGAAGQRYVADTDFRARIQKRMKGRGPVRSNWLWTPVLAGAAALLILGAITFVHNQNRTAEQQVLGELADLHVATLASANPVDVVSSDRHTVKPWFEGKIPFTFNLPDLQDTPFTLVGGKVSYLHQSPGAELIFRVRQHEISVFIFQERALVSVRANNRDQTARSFTVRSWSHNGLRYFVISDVAAQDIDKLSELIKAAG
jgi:anti-sigma factor RsiW